jgi:hypothetical protein
VEARIPCGAGALVAEATAPDPSAIGSIIAPQAVLETP